MKVLDKIVKGDVAPKQTGVLWLNTTDGKLYTFDERGKGWIPEYDADTVKEVDTLPEITEENKTKIFKLKDEANLYAPALIKSTTAYTNKLPDEQQIDKAYLYDGDAYYYKGAYKIVCSDGEIDGYLWGEYIVSLKNAETITQDSGTIYYVADGGVFDNVNKTITFDTDLASFKSENEDTNGFVSAGVILVCAIYNAPEEAQIRNAGLNNANMSNLEYEYKGRFITIEYTDGIISGYLWEDTDNGEYLCLSSKPASEIYAYYNEDAGAYLGDFQIFDIGHADYITWDSQTTGHSSSSKSICVEIVGDQSLSSLTIVPLNAPDEEQVGKAYIDDGSEYCIYTGRELTAIDRATGNSKTLYEYYWEEEDSHITFGGPRAQDLFGQHTKFLRYNFDYSQHVYYWDSSDSSKYIYPASIYTVPYTSMKITEEWDYISAFPVIEKRVLMKYAGEGGKYMNLPTEGFVNVNGETMEYKGKTYYKWICIEETEAGKSRNRDVLNEDQEVLDGQIMILLTTSLDPNLPFSPNSPEWAYLISSEDYEDIYNAQDDPIAQEAYIDKFGNMTIRV